MSLVKNTCRLSALILSGLLLPLSSVQASSVPNVSVSISNLSPANGLSFTPVFLAFHDGSFDPFDVGTKASSAIQVIAERGMSAELSNYFSSNHPDGLSHVLTATSNGFGPGVFLPGAYGTVEFALDPIKHRYLSYFSMLLPSNDRFLGNDNPREITLFDSNGQFVGGSFQDNANTIWDSGTEQDGRFGAAFVAGSSSAGHVGEDGVIQSNFDFSVYNGFTTPAGFDFNNLPGATTPLLRIDVAPAPVPLPAAVWLFGSALPLFGWMRRRSLASNLSA
ncbi:MAG: hypothetical protein CTY19_05425 [Methylomonas sp.]|nr:MAG: hypothetical protein CTY19_05425 [Methylomonas sp.]